MSSLTLVPTCRDKKVIAGKVLGRVKLISEGMDMVSSTERSLRKTYLYTRLLERTTPGSTFVAQGMERR